jgi:hypothetical protein
MKVNCRKFDGIIYNYYFFQNNNNNNCKIVSRVHEMVGFDLYPKSLIFLTIMEEVFRRVTGTEAMTLWLIQAYLI